MPHDAVAFYATMMRCEIDDAMSHCSDAILNMRCSIRLTCIHKSTVGVGMNKPRVVRFESIHSNEAIVLGNSRIVDYAKVWILGYALVYK